MARDYRSAQYRAQQGAIDPNTGLPGRQVDGQDNSDLAGLLASRYPAPYTMPAPSYGDPSAGSSFEDLTSQYERRNEGAGGAGRGAVGGAAAGATVGSMVPVLGTMAGAGIGALVGGIGGAFTKNAESAMTDFSLADASDTIRNAYRQKMGREASQGEIDSQLGAVGWKPGHDWVGEMGLQGIVNNLDPANDRRAAAAAPGVSNPLQAPASGAGTTPAAAPGGQFTGGSGALVDPYALPEKDTLEGLLAGAQRYTDYDANTGRTGYAGAGGGDGYSYSGFDFAQDAGNRDIGKSAKYAFSEFSKQAAMAGAPMPRTKADAEAWFNQYIAPKMQAAGYAVNWVKGDKAQIQTREGLDTIDFVGGADGDNPTLTWQSEVLAPGSGMQGGGMGMGGGSLPASGMNLGSSALFQTLMQQAQDIASGKTNGASILDTNALLSLLGK
jgi:hypothetical protein